MTLDQGVADELGHRLARQLGSVERRAEDLLARPRGADVAAHRDRLVDDVGSPCLEARPGQDAFGGGVPHLDRGHDEVGLGAVLGHLHAGPERDRGGGTLSTIWGLGRKKRSKKRALIHDWIALRRRYTFRYPPAEPPESIPVKPIVSAVSLLWRIRALEGLCSIRNVQIRKEVITYNRPGRAPWWRSRMRERLRRNQPAATDADPDHLEARMHAPGALRDLPREPPEWEIRYHLQWLVRHGVVALRPGPRAIHCYPTGKRLAA